MNVGSEYKLRLFIHIIIIIIIMDIESIVEPRPLFKLLDLKHSRQNSLVLGGGGRGGGSARH
jgi:hypothetical protein